MAVDLDLVKSHLRVNFASDDDYIEGLIGVAEAYVASIGVAIAAPLPAPVQHAILLMVSHFYQNRDAVTAAKSVPLELGVNALLQPYRSFPV